MSVLAWNWLNVDARYNSFLIRFYCGLRFSWFFSYSIPYIVIAITEINPEKNRRTAIIQEKAWSEQIHIRIYTHTHTFKEPNILFKHEMKISLKTSDLWKTENVTMLNTEWEEVEWRKKPIQFFNTKKNNVRTYYESKSVREYEDGYETTAINGGKYTKRKSK